MTIVFMFMKNTNETNRKFGKNKNKGKIITGQMFQRLLRTSRAFSSASL